MVVLSAEYFSCVAVQLAPCLTILTATCRVHRSGSTANIVTGEVISPRDGSDNSPHLIVQKNSHLADTPACMPLLAAASEEQQHCHALSASSAATAKAAADDSLLAASASGVRTLPSPGIAEAAVLVASAKTGRMHGAETTRRARGSRLRGGVTAISRCLRPP